MKSITFRQIIICSISVTVLSVILIPFLRFQKQSGLPLDKVTAGAMRIGQAALLYSQDWDDRLPRLDNNGSCLFGESPCNLPDWAELLPPNQNYALLEQGKRVMFFGATLPYLASQEPYVDPFIHFTRWKKINNSMGTVQLQYGAGRESFYDWSNPHMAVNLLMVDYNSSSASQINNRPGAIKGHLPSIQNPQNKILVAMESSFDFNNGLVYGLGALAVMGTNYGSPCYANLSQNRVFYPIEGRREIYTALGSANEEFENGNLEGRAGFLFADLHVEFLHYPNAEACALVPKGGSWTAKSGDTRNFYYPKWVPEIE